MVTIWQANELTRLFTIWQADEVTELDHSMLSYKYKSPLRIENPMMLELINVGWEIMYWKKKESEDHIVVLVELCFVLCNYWMNCLFGDFSYLYTLFTWTYLLESEVMTLIERGVMMDDDYFSCRLIGCCANGRKVGDCEWLTRKIDAY